ncbi:MAG: diaminopimelate decarboxylase [Candidatus Saccharibacteria bacterium]
MSVEKNMPFSDEVFADIADQFGTPTYVYDEAGIRDNARQVNEAFSWSPSYINYFAVKATPVPAVLRAVKSEGMGFDCSSDTELHIVKRQIGGNNQVFYTSNNTPDADYRYADGIGATINIDKLPYLEQVRRALGRLPTTMAIRYNPGELKKTGDDNSIGEPQYAKFGDTEEHVLDALKHMRDGGVEEIGLHTMLVTNNRNPESFAETARLLRELAEKAEMRHGIDISFINIGGGIGVNYHPDEQPVDVAAIGEAVGSELGPMGIPIVSENGRYITGPHGYMLTRVTHGIIESHIKFLEVDTSVNNMARLATVSSAYHELMVLGREDDPRELMTVVGSMCANSDKFFKDRMLPKTTKPGDLTGHTRCWRPYAV